jgi:hypothetical protein
VVEVVVGDFAAFACAGQVGESEVDAFPDAGVDDFVCDL